MKKLSVLMFALLLATVACNTNSGENHVKVDFAIYETVMVQDLPSSPTTAHPALTAEGANLVLNKDPGSAIVAYAHVDSTFSIDTPVENQMKFLRTAQPVDPEQQYYAIVAVKTQPVMTGSDLKTTKANKNNVEISFNLKGARKWAEMTRNNIGKTIAITIDDRVYALPTVMAEIREGRAMISGLENEETAVKISAVLNKSL
jgi:preprotein translocase subunit SecD